jgi:matrixin
MRSTPRIRGPFAVLATVSALGAFTAPGAWTPPAATAATYATPAVSAASSTTAATTTVSSTPTNSVVARGSSARVTGTVSGPVRRPVQLQRLVGRSWRAVATAATSSTRRYTFTLPTKSDGSLIYRVLAPAVASAPSGSGSAFTVNVGSGKASSYKLFSPAARWNPCSAIGYRVNLTGAPSGALSDVKAAVGRVSLATGLRYVYRGTTGLVPGTSMRSDKFLNAYPADTQLVVAWANRGVSTYLPKGSTALAYGGWLSKGSAYRGYYPIAQGYVVARRDLDLPSGFGTGRSSGMLGTWGQVLMHEVGHTVGLDHISDKTQLMYAMTQRKVPNWGLGDLTGLKAVGSRAGCFPRG